MPMTLFLKKEKSRVKSALRRSQIQRHKAEKLLTIFPIFAVLTAIRNGGAPRGNGCAPHQSRNISWVAENLRPSLSTCLPLSLFPSGTESDMIIFFGSLLTGKLGLFGQEQGV